LVPSTRKRTSEAQTDLDADFLIIHIGKQRKPSAGVSGGAGLEGKKLDCGDPEQA